MRLLTIPHALGTESSQSIPNDQINLLSRHQPRVLRFFSIRLIRCRGALHPHESRKQVGESGLIVAQFLWTILLCGSSPIIILHAVFHSACDRALLDCYLGLTNVNIFLPSSQQEKKRLLFNWSDGGTSHSALWTSCLATSLPCLEYFEDILKSRNAPAISTCFSST